MKKATFKKALSVVLALCMIVTLFAGISLVPSSASASDTKMLHVQSTSATNRFGYRPSSGKGSLVKNTKYRLSLDWEDIKNAPFGDTTFLLYVYDGAWKKVNSSTSTSEWNITSYPLEHGMHYDIDFTTKASSGDFRELVFWFGDLDGSVSDMQFKTANWVLYTRDANNNLTDTNYTPDFDQISFRDVGDVTILDNFPSKTTNVRGSFCRKGTMSSQSEFVDIPNGYFDVAEEVPATPDLVEFAGYVAGNSRPRLEYYANNSNFPAGNYKFEIDCKILSGTPRISIGANSLSEGANLTNYTAKYDEENYKYTITFTASAAFEPRIRVGIYYNVARFYVANPALYLVDNDGNPTSENLINTFSSDFYTSTDSNGKWTVKETGTEGTITETTIPDGFFDTVKSSLIEIKDTNGYNRLDYIKEKGLIYAGDYRFEMDCKVFSGTPIVRIGADSYSAGSGLANYNVVGWNEDTNKYIINFTLTENFIGNIQIRIGNYTDSNFSHFVFANPTLYKIEDGNSTGYNLINTTTSKFITTGAQAEGMWRNPVPKEVNVTTLPAGYFDKVVTTGTPYMAIFQQGTAYKYLEYNDESLPLVKGKTYTLSIDERDVVGSPTFEIANIGDVSDKKVGTTRTLTFTMSSTKIGVKILVGNYSNATNVSAKYANVRLVENGQDRNLIAGFSSDTMYNADSTDPKQNKKWRRAGRSVAGDIATFYTVAIPNGYLENTLNDKMFYFDTVKTGNWHGNHIYYTGVTVEPNKTYTLKFDWKSYAGSTPSVVVFCKDSNSDFTNRLVVFQAPEYGTYGNETFTFTTPETMPVSGTYNLRIGIGADVNYKDYMQTRGQFYFGNFVLTEAGSSENLLVNGDLKLANAGDVTKTSDAPIAWQLNYTPEANKYDALKIIDQPDNFFTKDGPAAKKMVTIDGGDYDYLRQDLVLESNTKYRLTYKALFVNAESSAFIQLINTENSYITPTYSYTNYDVDTRTKTMEFTTFGNMKETKQNTILQFYIGRDGDDVKLSISDVKLYKVVDGKTVGGNLINNGGFFFGDEVELKNLASESTDSRSTGYIQLLGWLIKGDFKTNKSVEVTDITADSFPADAPTYANQKVNIKKYLLDLLNVNTIDDNYIDANNDGKKNICDLVAVNSDAVGADDEAAAWKAQYLNGNNATSDEILNKFSGTTYYVDAVNGKDTNTGRSTSEAWQTLSKVSKASLNSGDKVLFKCGSVWRSDISSSWGTVDDVFTAQSGVFYGSYGEGAKPVISGSAKNYGGKDNQSNWTQVSGMKDVWQYNLGSTADAGIVVYNDGKEELIANMTTTKDGVANGENGDFCHSYGASYNNKNYIYVKSDMNPALKWLSIEIGVGRHVVAMANNTTFDNIAVMYTGKHGFNGSNVKNVTIQNCYISHIGGSFNDSRLGNGIQFGISGENLKVVNTYVSECFDAGLTFQTWQSAGVSGYWREIEFSNNLVENCHYSVEWFGITGTEFKNIYIDNNIFKGAGYGWSYDERVGFGEDMGVIQVSHFRGGSNNAYYDNMTNFQFTNNILDSSKRNLVYWWWNDSNVADANIKKLKDGMFEASGNSFYQRSGCEDYITQYISETRIGGCSSSKVLEALKEFEDTNAPTGSARFIYDEQNVIIE